MKTRKCTECGEIKSIDLFYNNSFVSHGKFTKCIDCVNIIKKKQRRTVDGLIYYMYSNQQTNSKKRNYPQPEYNRKELKEWIIVQPNFYSLYDKWVDSNYNTDYKPSVDRIDDYKSYTLDNIQLTTSFKNIDRSYKDKINGINNKQSKAVLQFDLNGNFIKEFYSQAQAARDLGIDASNISRVCNGKYESIRGFVWKHKD